MSCQIFFQPDIIAIRKNNSGNYTSAVTGDNWTTDLVTASTFTSSTTIKGGTSAALAFNFNDDTTVTTTAAVENTDYKMIGFNQSDSTSTSVSGDIIDDSVGKKPVSNFDNNVTINVYSNPNTDYDSTLVTETLAANADTTTVAHFNALQSFMNSKCQDYDIMLVDSNNLIAALWGRMSGRVEKTMPFGTSNWFYALIFEAKVSDNSQNMSLIALTSIT